MRAAAFALLLAGCSSGPCLFGAERAEDARACAVRNFGEAEAREMVERQNFCRVCGESELPACVVTCED